MISGISSGTNPLQQAMQQLFSKNDSNADGKLDTSEISSLLETLQGTSDSTSGLSADDVIAAFDSDGDGNVTSTEFDSGFQNMATSMQAELIAAQESGQMPPPPHGPPPGAPPASASSEEDDEEDTTISTLVDLLEQYSSASESEEASASNGETSTDTLVQSFLAQLEKYARSQDYLAEYGSQNSSLSVSA